MSLTVEDGTGLSNADSYLSIADADTYHSDRGNSSWTGTDTVKEQYLRKATEYLDRTFDWLGDIKKTTQSLNWPRDNVEDKQGRDLSDQVPVIIKNATAELALEIISSDLDANTTKSDYVKREKVGQLEIEYKDGSPSSKQFNRVVKMLNGLYSSMLSNSSSVSLVRS